MNEIEAEAMSYIIASIRRKDKENPNRRVPTMEELRKKLADSIFTPNPLFEKLLEKAKK